MAIKQWVLKKIEKSKSMLERCPSEDIENVLPQVVSLLKNIDRSLRDGLHKDYYAQYKEIINGIIVALNYLVSGMDMGEQHEIILTSRDLLMFTEKRIAKETHFKKVPHTHFARHPK